ncbi:hypothetical protein GCM10027586_00660 [Kineococcus gypseus]|uniref:CotH kinase family protein n=1 Tax=Kineococcus gypseus TaxID=1637102 RepID=UPI003D7DA9AD
MSVTTQPSPDYNRKLLRWAGNYGDGSPAEGTIEVTPVGKGMALDDDEVMPLGIFSSQFSFEIGRTPILINGEVREAGYVAFHLPANNDPDIIGGPTSYIITEKLRKGGGREPYEIVVDIDAPDEGVWLTKIAPAEPVPGQPLSVVYYSDFTALADRVETLEAGGVSGGGGGGGGGESAPVVMVENTATGAYERGDLWSGTVDPETLPVGQRPTGHYAWLDANALAGGTAQAPAPATATAFEWAFGPLPHVTIDTVGAAPITDTRVYVNGSISINGAVPYSGTIQIRGRGNTSWAEVKKPYRIKLTTAAPLLGMPAERDWVLLANYLDPIAIRTAVAFNIAARCPGLAWTPRMRWVEVTLNGAYGGLYQLGEHVEISPSKINVTKATGTTGLALTGAYTLEIDHWLDGSGELGFHTTMTDLPIKTDDPDGSTPAQMAYIKGFIDSFESALYGANWLDPATGYARFIDRDSFVDWYLVNELLANVDSNFFSSCKFYKTRDTAEKPGVLVMGPVWDFDRSLGYGNVPPTGWRTRLAVEDNHPGAIWIDRMMADPAFWSVMRTHWYALASSLTTGDSIFAVIDRLIDGLTHPSSRDRRAWGLSADTLALSASAKAWLRARIAWISEQFTPETPPVPDTTAPDAPSGLVESAVTPTSATLTWYAVPDAASYRVYVNGLLRASPTSTATALTGLDPATEYTVTVRAVDSSSNASGDSNEVTFTTADAPIGGGSTETFDTADAPGWPAGWTTYRDASIVSNRGRLSGSDYAAAAAWTNGPDLGDFDLTAVAQSSGSNHLIYFGSSPDPATYYVPDNGYTLVLDVFSSGSRVYSMRINRASSANRQSIAFAEHPTQVETSTGWNVRFKRAGATLAAKVWVVGTAEPDAWDITVTDTNPLTFAGHVWLAEEGAGGVVDVDSITVT